MVLILCPTTSVHETRNSTMKESMLLTCMGKIVHVCNLAWILYKFCSYTLHNNFLQIYLSFLMRKGLPRTETNRKIIKRFCDRTMDQMYAYDRYGYVHAQGEQKNLFHRKKRIIHLNYAVIFPPKGAVETAFVGSFPNSYRWGKSRKMDGRSQSAY